MESTTIPSPTTPTVITTTSEEPTTTTVITTTRMEPPPTTATTKATTMIPTVTPCTSDGLNRTDKVLGEECGKHGANGRCNVSYSACMQSRIDTSWKCRCSQGFAKRVLECEASKLLFWSINIWEDRRGNHELIFFLNVDITLSAHYCPETLATFVSQGTELRKKAQTKIKTTTQKTNKMSNTGPH